MKFNCKCGWKFEIKPLVYHQGHVLLEENTEVQCLKCGHYMELEKGV